MNIHQAIKILTEHIKISKLDYLPDVRDATMLGIEALNKVRFQRSSWRYPDDGPLPGETEE